MYHGKFAGNPGDKKRDQKLVTEEAQKDKRYASAKKGGKEIPQDPGALKFSPKQETAEEPDLNFNFQKNPQQFVPFEDEEAYEQPAIRYKRKWLGTIIGGLLFYGLLIAAVFAFHFKLNGKLDLITEQLENYEQLQPKYVSQHIFGEVFGKPDWGKIYDEAQVQISRYEGKDAYVSYMNAKVGDTPLICQAVPSEKDGQLSYRVSLENEKIADFTMSNISTDPQAPDWQKDGIQVYFKPEESFRIQCGLDQIVKVNGIQLENFNLIQQTGIRMKEDLGTLSAGAELPGACVYEITDFLVKPTVTVEDKEGNQLQVSYDEDTHTFSVPIQGQAVPEEVRKLALDAVTTYCEFMIQKANRAELGKFFKQDSHTYWAITDSDLTWIQEEKNHSTANEQVYDYVKFNDKAFAVRVSLTWQLTRSDNSVKESPVDESLIFEQEANGKWRCTRMTGKKLLEPYKLVRVRFIQRNKVLSSQMVETGLGIIACPQPEPRDNKVLDGWVTVLKDENGQDYYRRVLDPDENSMSAVPEGLFENAVDLRPVYVNP